MKPFQFEIFVHFRYSFLTIFQNLDNNQVNKNEKLLI